MGRWTYCFLLEDFRLNTSSIQTALVSWTASGADMQYEDRDGVDIYQYERLQGIFLSSFDKNVVS